MSTMVALQDEVILNGEVMSTSIGGLMELGCIHPTRRPNAAAVACENVKMSQRLSVLVKTYQVPGSKHRRSFFNSGAYYDGTIRRARGQRRGVPDGW